LLLRHEQVLPVCAPALLERRPLARTADLLALPLLHIQSRPNAWRDWLEQRGADAPPDIPGSTYDQFSTILQAALHGLGVALMPDYLVETELATGQLRPALGPATEARGAYYLVWPKTRDRDPSLRLFRDWMAGQAQPEDPLPR